MSLNIGYIVKDKENDDNLAVVVNILDKKAKDVAIPNMNKSVYEVNQDYSSDSGVAEIVFKSKLDRHIPKWWMKNKNDIKSQISKTDITIYRYPIERLRFEYSSLSANGFEIRVYGVADPINQDLGSFSIDILDNNRNIIHSQSKIIHKYSYIDSDLSCLIGIKYGIEWLFNNKKSVDGLSIITNSKNVIKQLNGDYNIRSDTHKEVYNDIHSSINNLKNYCIENPMSDILSELEVRAINTFEDYQESKADFNIQKVIDDEFIVNNSYSVDLTNNTCTCDQNGICEHIEAVANENGYNLAKIE